MKEYTFSEARQKLAPLLDEAKEKGSVIIRRGNGQTFMLKPSLTNGNKPLSEIKGVDLGLTRDEIVEAVRDSRSMWSRKLDELDEYRAERQREKADPSGAD